MDILNSVLDTLSFNSNFYYTVRFSGKWGVEIPRFYDVARFHICCEGKCIFRISGVDKLVELSAGDMLIITHGASHAMLDCPTTPVIELDEAYVRVNYNGSKVFEYSACEGDGFGELLCGHFEFVDALEHPLVHLLPPAILLKQPEDNEFRWLKEALVAHTRTEMVGKPANKSIINRLSEIVFVLAVQRWQEENGVSGGFLAAISDPQISRALRAFHQNIERRWTINDLAGIALMSRTQFVDRFTKLVKMPPIQYITLWRMNSAQKMLRCSEKSIQFIANKSGYESVTAFSKAFKRYTELSPGGYRKARRAIL